MPTGKGFCFFFQKEALPCFAFFRMSASAAATLPPSMLQHLHWRSIGPFRLLIIRRRFWVVKAEREWPTGARSCSKTQPFPTAVGYYGFNLMLVWRATADDDDHYVYAIAL